MTRYFTFLKREKIQIAMQWLRAGFIITVAIRPVTKFWTHNRQKVMNTAIVYLKTCDSLVPRFAYNKIHS